MAASDGQLPSAVDGRGMADVGGGQAVIQLWIAGIGDKRRSVGGNAGIPGRAIIEISGPGINTAQLKSARELMPHIDFERVVVADALRNP